MKQASDLQCSIYRINCMFFYMTFNTCSESAIRRTGVITSHIRSKCEYYGLTQGA